MDPSIPLHVQAQISQQYLSSEEVRSFLHDDAPTEPVLDYVTNIDIRRDIFQQFQSFFENEGHGEEMNAAMFAIIMVAPINELQESLRNPANALISSRLAPQAIRSYIPKGRLPTSALTTPAPGTPTRPANSPISHRRNPSSEVESFAQSPARRNFEPVRQCKIRDLNKCIFMHTLNPEAAHIFPFSTSATARFAAMDSAILTFWGLQTYTKWTDEYKNTQVTESPQNLLSMNKYAHSMWDSAEFALKPLRESVNEIVVQWHWLKHTTLTPRKEIPHNTDVRDFIDPKGWGDGLVHRESGRKIRTGQTFVIRAEDPRHLPSFKLLELQWDLLRVAAICGAAGKYDEEFDDEDSWGGLGEPAVYGFDDVLWY
ncbi:hypothetical protein V8C37DRAFT_392155 [Trichoderma ceciliae]